MAMCDTPPSVTRTRTRTESSRKFNLGVLGSMVIAAAMLVSTMLVSQPAAAQSACGERANILQNLERVHSETPRALGLSADGKLLKILVSPTGSWTILVSYPGRLTCLVAAGEDWERLPVLPTGPSA